ncbi:hypothetical protein SAMN05444161_5692 [Rhizobiales bacterium GAS191]|jgi:hypothetical protein|nr:hypothetical protein SAMN05519103_04888 [Rhizobiales bacterium GAS113]SEE41574.1 hypothetical protein SAMN05444161_5692 [Rhizobiales bacterium GAS191]
MADSKPQKVAGREKEPKISATVTDELREEEGEIAPTEGEDARTPRGGKPLIAIMTPTTRKKTS